MATKVEAAKMMVYKAAMAKATQKVYSVEAAQAKLYAAEVAMEVTWWLRIHQRIRCRTYDA